MYKIYATRSLLFVACCSALLLAACRKPIVRWEAGTVTYVHRDWIGTTNAEVCCEHGLCATVYQHDFVNGLGLADMHEGQKVLLGISEPHNLQEVRPFREIDQGK